MIPLYLVLPWTVPFIVALSAARRKPSLTDYPPADGGLVSVIIPARNEAATIATILASLRGCEYPQLEILVVNDRSTDATAELVRAEAAADPRIRLIDGEELPPGWYGKPWACVQGYRASRGDILLFTDADTRHSPTLLGRAVGALLSERPGLLTVAPKQLCLTFWERAVMPQIWLLLALRYFPERVNRAVKSRDVIANGQFIMLRREVYQSLGTHAAVQGAVAEDLAMAQLAHARGERVWFAFAETLMETRMYDGLTPMIEGWSKNLVLGGRQTFPNQPVLRAMVPVMLAAAMLFWLAPWALLLSAFVAPTLLWPGAVAVGLCLLFWLGTMRAMEIPSQYALAYPAGSVMALYIIIRSAWRGGRRVEWKGRTYSEGKPGQPASS